MRVAQTKPSCEYKSIQKQLVFLLNKGFFAEKKFYREHLLLCRKLNFHKILMRTTRVLNLTGSVKGALDVQKVLPRFNGILVQKTPASKSVLFQLQGAFLLLVTLLALFQQFVDDAGSVDGKKQNLKVAQSAKVDSATGILQKHQFELPVNCNDDVELFSASPHDSDVLPITRELFNQTLWYKEFSKNSIKKFFKSDVAN